MMTYTTALTNAIAILSNDNQNDETVARLQSLVATLEKRNAQSDSRKEAQARKRADARNAIVEVVSPIVREALTNEPQTAKQIFDKCEGLPADFTANKVQYLLLHELADEVVKNETKGKPNTYIWKGRV